MPGGKGEFYVLDKSPAKTTLCPDGKVRPIQRPKEIFRSGAHALFQRENLYAVSFPGVRADELERQLFGMLDHYGARANEMFCGWPEANGMFFVPRDADVPSEFGHPTQRMSDLIEFLDAQKTRTPKGLDQIKALLAKRGVSRPHNNLLMLFLQQRRVLNCTVWAECIWEIFTAVGSERFLLSDDPVVIYNCDCYPLSGPCTYPNDPDPFWRGSRVLWPLSANKLLVLTHAEHCDQASRLKARKNRRNARSNGNVLLSYTDVINERTFNDQQVVVINTVIKARASRYVASAIEEQLFPERRLKAPRWHEIDALFHPRYPTYHASRKVVVRYTDDSVMHTNAYGESDTVPGWFARVNEARKKREAD